MSSLPLISRAISHADSIAFQSENASYTYQQLLDKSVSVATDLLNGRSDLQQDRVAYLVPAGFHYAAVQWGIWRSGGVAVPLSLSATESEWHYALSDSRTNMVVTTEALAPQVAGLCKSLKLRLVVVDQISKSSDTADSSLSLPQISGDRSAMILYTSGTTNKPKGVVSTHATVTSQIETLVDAWQWQSSDRIPLFLPLHHIHGIINVMSCALWSGACVEPFAKFEMPKILSRVSDDAYSVFMAVPTIYVKMIQAIQGMTNEQRQRVVDGFAKMRLMVSGSAALPASIHEQWTDLTTQKLLERYGMTEIGMALSNPYIGQRKAGMVGQPLPGVEVRLVSESGAVLTDDGEPGEIQVRGPNVFTEYFDRKQATNESFDNGWFRTGDIAVCENGYYRIMGRQSVDIIKSGGYKLSALEIEAALLDHESIKECAVVGLPDETWGQSVAVAVVLHQGQHLELQDLRNWCDGRVSKYKMPKQLLVVDSLPRNAMGKVTKPAVTSLF